MKITRSLKTVTGDVTAKTGDVVISNPDKGIVMENQDSAVQQRIVIVTEDGEPTLKIEEV
jgi:hypothetical protein